MKVKELYDHILKHMTAEEALMKLLGSASIHYEKLKFDNKVDVVHPELIISFAAFDLGWDMAIERDPPGGQVRGIVVGTPEYIRKVHFTGLEETLVGIKKEYKEGKCSICGGTKMIEEGYSVCDDCDKAELN